MTLKFWPLLALVVLAFPPIGSAEDHERPRPNGQG